jgi:dihydroorotase
MLVTSEVTPHHLTFDTTSQANQGTYLQVNPPIRSRDHRDCLFQALRDGIITTIGSDHAPHTREEKSCHYPNSPSGVPGVQTLVSVMLDHIHKKRLKLQDFVRLTSYGPHIVFGIKNKGRMVCGYDADFTIVDMKKEREIENSWIASRARWTPYAGMKTTGAPVGTMIRGRLVMWNDEITAPPQGTLVQFTS